eukprot:COSAG01_NODE_13163_length_1626_cov_1.466929_4_plen_37_part_00
MIGGGALLHLEDGGLHACKGGTTVESFCRAQVATLN